MYTNLLIDYYRLPFSTVFICLISCVQGAKRRKEYGIIELITYLAFINFAEINLFIIMFVDVVVSKIFM